MSSTNTALAFAPRFDEPAFAMPAPSARPRLVSSNETAADDSAVLDWFADLTWSQILPIATVFVTLVTGLMCVSMLTLGA